MHDRKEFNNKLITYIEHVITYFNFLSKEYDNQKPIYELKNKKQRMIDAVLELESGSIIGELAHDLASDYYDMLSENRSDEWHFDGMPPDMQLLIATFFRRSLFYIQAFNGEEIDKDQLINLFWEAFLAKHISVRCLAPIEFVEFATNKPMDYGFFVIRKFSQEELSRILNNEINEKFYEDCVWDIRDIKTLAKYWFIDVPNVKISTDSLIRGIFSIIKTDNKLKRSNILEPINDIVDRLILYNWNQEHEEIICQGFNIPFVIQIDEYPIAHPESSPDMTMLNTIPHEMNGIGFQWIGEGGMPFGFDQFKKSIEYYPIRNFLLNGKQTKSFIKHINKINKVYTEDVFNVWPFMRIAFNYLQKGLFTYEDLRFTEQFLLYVMVIEALLGEKKDGLMNLMANRLSRILGEYNKERDKIRSQFKKIYDTRSRLIHGDNCNNEDIIKNLNLARVLAQDACIWFLNYLHNILRMYKNKGKMPDRKDIMRIIDLKIGEQKSINQLSKLTEKRFKTFPYIKIS